MAEDPAKIGTWWSRLASPVFAHISYSGWLRSPEHAVEMWRQRWLDELCPGTTCAGMRIVEYGIGAGLLGQHMLHTLHAGHYVGIDASWRQLWAARRLLRKRNVRRGAFTLLPASHGNVSHFASLRPDAFISQQVIQHMPSTAYLERFLLGVDACGASLVMLQTKWPASPSWHPNWKQGRLNCSAAAELAGASGCSHGRSFTELPRCSDGYCWIQTANAIHRAAGKPLSSDKRAPGKMRTEQQQAADAVHDAVYGDRDVTCASLVSTEYLTARLPSYRLVNVTAVLEHGSLLMLYHRFRLRRTRSDSDG